jgi:hypothetical protein
MAAQNASATGADTQGDVRKRQTGQPNGNYVPNQLQGKMDEKTKEKVNLSHITALRWKCKLTGR